MSTVFDIIGSTLIAGVFLLLMINLSTYSTQSKAASDSELILINNAKTLADILNNDLRKVGYKYDGTSILTIEQKKFTFFSDIDNNGSIDIVSYALSDSLKADGTPNPRDKILYRIVNGDTSKGPSLGLVDLKFSYLNQLGQPTNTISEITYVKTELWVETTQTVDGTYPFTYWEMTINPRNL